MMRSNVSSDLIKGWTPSMKLFNLGRSNIQYDRVRKGDPSVVTALAGIMDIRSCGASGSIWWDTFRHLGNIVNKYSNKWGMVVCTGIGVTKTVLMTMVCTDTLGWMSWRRSAGDRPSVLRWMKFKSNFLRLGNRCVISINDEREVLDGPVVKYFQSHHPDIVISKHTMALFGVLPVRDRDLTMALCRHFENLLV